MPTPTTDFSIFDDQELMTYDPITGSVIEDLPALRRPLTQSRQRNVERYVELLATDVVFHLEAAPLESATMAVGDTLMDANSISYQVIFFERQTLNNIVAVVGRPVV